MLAAASVSWKINGALTLGIAIGDEPEAFPMHGCEIPERSDPFVAGCRSLCLSLEGRVFVLSFFLVSFLKEWDADRA